MSRPWNHWKAPSLEQQVRVLENTIESKSDQSQEEESFEIRKKLVLVLKLQLNKLIAKQNMNAVKSVVKK